MRVCVYVLGLGKVFWAFHTHSLSHFLCTLVWLNHSTYFISLSLFPSLLLSLPLSPSPLPPSPSPSLPRDMSVRCIVDAAYQVMVYSDFELILEIVCAMASDHGECVLITVSVCWSL